MWRKLILHIRIRQIDGPCATVAQVNGEMKVLFDKLVCPVCGDLSVYSQRSN